MKDPYVYEGTNTLINKLNIKDSAKLDKAESDLIPLRIQKIKTSDFQISTIFDCLVIHKNLFFKLFDWAGQLRTIDIYKGEPLLDGHSVDYVYSSYLKEALQELEKEFEATKWEELNPEEKLEKVCYFVSEFWHIHPFREGNTRTTAVFLYFLLKKVGLHVNLDFLNKNGKYFRNSLVLSCLYSSSKKEYLLGIVKDSVTLKNEESKKYETIEGKEVNKYEYTTHTVEKMKTIKKPKDWKK